MLLGAFDFLDFSFTDLLDIILIALVIFYAIKSIRGTSAMNILIALISLFFIKVIVSALGMKMMTELMSVVLDVGVVAIIVIFQPEIRRFLIHLGQKYMIGRRGSFLFNRLFGRDAGAGVSADSVKEIAEACQAMSQTKTGALIVIAGNMSLDQIVETGDRVDAIINRRLLMNLFFKNSPLHDGAMIIDGGRIAAARCTLPITERQDIPAHYGMRHKAAIGMSETCDALILVVSEETGNISFVRGGNIRTVGSTSELRRLLTPTAAEKTTSAAEQTPSTSEKSND